jgi:hypothetical protein
MLLRDKFTYFLISKLRLKDDHINAILARGWGLAGIIQDDHTIIATKIPKSSNLANYLEQDDPAKKRLMYCHCPRIREAIGDDSIPSIYCNCGAGFYKGIWDYILDKPVDVTVKQSLLAGDDLCQFEIKLPDLG